MFALHDFDGDGMPELHSASYRKKEPLEVWRFDQERADGAPALTPFVLGAEGGGHGFAFGDVNGDGREDVLTESRLVRAAGRRSVRAALEAPPRDRAAASELPVRGEGPQRGRPARHHLRPRATTSGSYWWEQQAPQPDGTDGLEEARHRRDPGRRPTPWRWPTSTATARRSWSPASASGPTTAAIPARPIRRPSTTTSGTRPASQLHPPHHRRRPARTSRSAASTASST